MSDNIISQNTELSSGITLFNDTFVKSNMKYI
jgi:hypothetical protein